MRHTPIAQQDRSAGKRVTRAPNGPLTCRRHPVGMTKSLNNGNASKSREERPRSLLSRGVEVAFPLVIVALGYLIGRQFFGF